MFPLRDYAGRQRITFPYVNVAIIILNVLVFFYELTLTNDQLNLFAERWGAVPARLSNALSTGSGSELLLAVATLFTAMFIHANLLHIGGNMLFLWVFGDNVEDSMGHWRYLAFYLIGGLAASLAQFAFYWGDSAPTIGASGAISAILGAYIVLFPRGRVVTLIFLIIPLIVRLPAMLMLGYWIALQVLESVLSLSSPQATGGVAVFAHVGGFITGAALIWVFRKRY